MISESTYCIWTSRKESSIFSVDDCSMTFYIFIKLSNYYCGVIIIAKNSRAPNRG